MQIYKSHYQRINYSLRFFLQICQFFSSVFFFHVLDHCGPSATPQHELWSPLWLHFQLQMTMTHVIFSIILLSHILMFKKKSLLNTCLSSPATLKQVTSPSFLKKEPFSFGFGDTTLNLYPSYLLGSPSKSFFAKLTFYL